MKFKLRYTLVAVTAFALGGWAGWNARTPGPLPEAGTVSPEPTATPQPARTRPNRPPEYFGVIEGIEVSSYPSGKVVASFLIRGQRPPVGMPEPTSPLFSFGGEPYRLRVNIVDTPIERSGPLGVGELLSVWHRGIVARSHPAQVCPEYVVCDMASRE